MGLRLNVMKLLPANPPGITQASPASCFFAEGAMFLRDHTPSNRKYCFVNRMSSGSCSSYQQTRQTLASKRESRIQLRSTLIIGWINEASLAPITFDILIGDT